MRISRIKRHIRFISGNIIILSVLAAVGILIVSPLCITAILSLTPRGGVFGFNADGVTFENYKSLIYLAREPFGVYVLNSVIITAGIVFLRLIIICPAAYVMAKVKFFGRRVLNITVEAALLFTDAAMQPLQYAAAAKLGIVNTYAAAILPFVPCALSLIILRGFIANIPDGVIDAARLDGAGILKIYNAVILPNVKPALSAIAVFAVADAWKAAGSPFVYSETLKPVSSVLPQAGDAGTAAAVSVVLMLLPVAAYAFFGTEVRCTMVSAGLKKYK